MTVIKGLRKRIGLFTHSNTPFEFCLYSLRNDHKDESGFFYRLFDIEVLFCKADPGYLLASEKLDHRAFQEPGVTSLTDPQGQIYLSPALLADLATCLEIPLLGNLCQFRMKEILSGAADNLFRCIPSLEIYRPFCEIETDFREVGYNRLTELATVADDAMNRYRYSRTASPETLGTTSSSPPFDKSKRAASKPRFLGTPSNNPNVNVSSKKCISTTFVHNPPIGDLGHGSVTQEHDHHMDVTQNARNLMLDKQIEPEDGTPLDANRKRKRIADLFTNLSTDQGINTDSVSIKAHIKEPSKTSEELRPRNKSISQLSGTSGNLVEPDQSKIGRNHSGDGKLGKKNMRNLTIWTEGQEEEHNSASLTAPPHISCSTGTSLVDQSQSNKNPDMRTQPQPRQSPNCDRRDHGPDASLPTRPMTSVQPPHPRLLKLPIPPKKRLAPRWPPVGPEASCYIHPTTYPTFSSANSAERHTFDSGATQHQSDGRPTRSTAILPPTQQMSYDGTHCTRRNASDQWNPSILTESPVPISPMLYTPVVPSTPTHLPKGMQGTYPAKSKADFMRIMENVYMQAEDTEDMRVQLEARLRKTASVLQKLENPSLMIEELAQQHFRAMSAAREQRITKAISELGRRMTKVEIFLTKREEERSRARTAVEERLREREAERAERAKQMGIDLTVAAVEKEAMDRMNETSTSSSDVAKAKKPNQLIVNAAKANSITVPSGYSPFMMTPSVRPPTPLFPTNYPQVWGPAPPPTVPNESVGSSSGIPGPNDVNGTSSDGEEEGSSNGSDKTDEGEIEIVEQCGQVQRRSSPRPMGGLSGHAFPQRVEQTIEDKELLDRLLERMAELEQWVMTLEKRAYTPS